MNSVEIYKRVDLGGRRLKTEKAMALHEDSQMAILKKAIVMEHASKQILNRHHRSPNGAEISITFGKVDTYVTLNDERSQGAAYAIDRGTKRSKGIRALAAGLVAAGL